MTRADLMAVKQLAAQQQTRFAESQSFAEEKASFYLQMTNFKAALSAHSKDAERASVALSADLSMLAKLEAELQAALTTARTAQRQEEARQNALRLEEAANAAARRRLVSPLSISGKGVSALPEEFFSLLHALVESAALEPARVLSASQRSKLETLSQVLLILVGKLSARNAEQHRTFLLGSLRVLRALVRVGCLAFPDFCPQSLVRSEAGSSTPTAAVRSSEVCLRSTRELCDFLYYRCLFESSREEPEVPADFKQAEVKSDPSGTPTPVARAELVDTSPVGPRSLVSSRLCPSPQARRVAFALLLELVSRDAAAFQMLVARLARPAMWPPRKGVWCYSPSDDLRPLDVPYVGLKNLGSTCYMNSVLQQLFHVKLFRDGVLNAASEVRSESPTPIDRSKSPLHSPKREERLQLTEKTLSPSSRVSNQSMGGAAAGWDTAMLRELQAMFAFLQYSPKRSFIPRSFCQAFRDWENRPLDVRVQQDAQEFGAQLFDKLKNLLGQCATSKQVFAQTFSGLLRQETTSKSCAHVSQRTEPFEILSLSVKNKANLQQALELFVEGELMDGENMYLCGQCQARVPAVKRVTLQTLPPVLFIHLKRFEFDYENNVKRKLNDFLEFPLQLDLAPYTSSGVGAHPAYASSGSADEKLAPATVPATASPSLDPPVAYSASSEYTLSGVVVHSGTADSGHYYSYIRVTPDAIDPELLADGDADGEDEALHLLEPAGSGVGEWIEFNDTFVKPFDVAGLRAACFGGSELVDELDPVTNTSSKVSRALSHSAYMLVYSRKADPSTSEACVGSASLATPLPARNSAQCPTPTPTRLESHRQENASLGELNQKENGTDTITVEAQTASPGDARDVFSGGEGRSENDSNFKTSDPQLQSVEYNKANAMEAARGEGESRIAPRRPRAQPPEAVLEWLQRDGLMLRLDAQHFDYDFMCFLWCFVRLESLESPMGATIKAAGLFSIAVNFVFRVVAKSRGSLATAFGSWMAFLFRVAALSPEARTWLLQAVADNPADWVLSLTDCPDAAGRDAFRQLLWSCLRYHTVASPEVRQRYAEWPRLVASLTQQKKSEQQKSDEPTSDAAAVGPITVVGPQEAHVYMFSVLHCLLAAIHGACEGKTRSWLNELFGLLRDFVSLSSSELQWATHAELLSHVVAYLVHPTQVPGFNFFPLANGSYERALPQGELSHAFELVVLLTKCHFTAPAMTPALTFPPLPNYSFVRDLGYGGFLEQQARFAQLHVPESLVGCGLYNGFVRTAILEASESYHESVDIPPCLLTLMGRNHVGVKYLTTLLCLVAKDNQLMSKVCLDLPLKEVLRKHESEGELQVALRICLALCLMRDSMTSWRVEYTLNYLFNALFASVRNAAPGKESFVLQCVKSLLLLASRDPAAAAWLGERKVRLAALMTRYTSLKTLA